LIIPRNALPLFFVVIAAYFFSNCVIFYHRKQKRDHVFSQPNFLPAIPGRNHGKTRLHPIVLQRNG